jgi:pSer/pThr/pTyr-binding forkhead associated (FHA) protein
MRLRCAHCEAQIDVEDAQTTGRKFLQMRCWMCGRNSLFDVAKPDPGASTFIEEAPAQQDGPAGALRLDGSLAQQTATLDLPAHKIISISVVAGTSLAMEREMTQPLLTIGRLGGGADFEIDDPQVSRLHCAIEVKTDAVFLRDLRSTNGTYLDEKRILSACLEHKSEFRIGVSTLRVSILPA